MMRGKTQHRRSENDRFFFSTISFFKPVLSRTFKRWYVPGILCLTMLKLAAEPIPYQNPGLWRKNSSGAMTIRYQPEENSIRFQADFQPGTDLWAYPELPLPKGIPPEAKTLAFEAKMTQKKSRRRLQVRIHHVRIQGRTNPLEADPGMAEGRGGSG